MQTGYAELVAMRYRQQANAWLLSTMDWGRGPAALPPAAANSCAWVLFKAGRHADALPYAEAAVEGDPHDGAMVDTLGQLRLAMGDATGAEATLRRGLDMHGCGSTRAALARALAAQGRYGEAAREAEAAVCDTAAFWGDDEPGRDHVGQLARQWRQLALGVQQA